MVPAGTTSLVEIFPATGIFTYAFSESFTNVFTGIVNTIVVVGQSIVCPGAHTGTV